MKLTIRFFIILFTIFTLTACVSVDTRLKREFEKIRRGPAGSPYKTITNFSSSLQCMDKLMLDKQVKNIPVLIESIDDKTEAVNAGTRDMLMSSISEMTIRSHAIKVITYGQDSANLISFMKSAKNTGAYKQTPMFDIQGSISQHDEDIVSTGHSLGLSLRKQGGGGLSESSSLSTIAMDLNVVNAGDMSIVPGVNASNSISILRHGKSFDADASINKFGIYFDISLNRTEGKTQALRNLVELSAIELIGKLVRVPYWNCLGAKDQSAHKTSNKHLFAQAPAIRQASTDTDTAPTVMKAAHKTAEHQPVVKMSAVQAKQQPMARKTTPEMLKQSGIRVYTEEVVGTDW